MRRLLARMIMGIWAAVMTWWIGAVVRGPDADPSVTRDLAVGAGLVGAGLAVGWANHELQEEQA